MLSLSKGMSATAAATYHEKEDYYLKGSENSEWIGKGAEDLGLHGGVEKDAFRAATKGYHPDTGEQLVGGKITKDPRTTKEKPEKPSIHTHRAGNDMAFSAPKSVSVAFAAGVDGIKEAHDAAVKAMMEYIQQHYSQYRTPGGFAVADNLVAAKFDHATSRAVDPQLHSHCFLLNMVRDANGEWKANEPSNIYKDQKALGALYRQQLAYELLKQGQEIVWTDEKQGFFALKSVDSNVVEVFSKRREAIEKQVEEWRASGVFKNVDPKKLYEMAALKTRDPKDTSLTKENVARIFCEGFAEAGTTAEKVRLEVENGKSREIKIAQLSAEEVIGKALEFHTDKEAVIDRAKLLDTAIKVSQGQHSIKELMAAIKNETVAVGQQRGRDFCTTAELKEIERGNLETVKNLAGTYRSVTSQEEVQKYLDRLKERENIKLTPGQIKAVMVELCGQNGVAIVQGDAGTGKTFVSEIIERFNKEVLFPSGRSHETINVAYTGKAALEMQEASGREGYTIDRFLNGYAKGTIAFTDGDPSKHQKAIKVDEASFVGARQQELLLKIVGEYQAKGFNVKNVFVGDTKQMQSIQAGDGYRQMQSLKETHVDYAPLKDINRQKDERLLQIATDLNKDEGFAGDRGVAALRALNELGCVVEISDRQKLLERLAADYHELSSQLSPDEKKAAKGEKMTVLAVVSTNADRRELNEIIRTEKIAKGEILPGEKFLVRIPEKAGVTADSYQVGQEVYFGGKRNKNTLEMEAWGAPRGTQGTITAIYPDRGVVNIQYKTKTSAKKKAQLINKEFRAIDLANNTSIYQVQERYISVGDRIMVLRNDEQCKNGNVGTIKTIEKFGALASIATVAIETGKEAKEVKITLDERGAYLDYGYAATSEKVQGATADASLGAVYVKPGRNNSQIELGSFGVDVKNVTPEQFQRWNSTLTETESGWSREIKNGDHSATLSVWSMRDKETGEITKSVRLDFHDQLKVIKDGRFRADMTAAGMFYVRENNCWTTSITNKQAAELIGKEHPLQDKAFLRHTRDELRAGKGREVGAVDVDQQAVKFGRQSINQLNITLTRARYVSRFYTNSVSGLEKAVQSIDMKTSTLHKAENDFKAEGGKKQGKGRSAEKEAGKEKEKAEKQAEQKEKEAVVMQKHVIHVAGNIKEAEKAAMKTGKPVFVGNGLDAAADNVKIASAQRVEQRDRAEMNRSSNTIAAAEGHAKEQRDLAQQKKSEMGWTTYQQRNNSPGYFKVDMGNFQHSWDKENGYTLTRQTGERDSVINMGGKITDYTSHNSDGSKTVSSTMNRGDGLFHTSETTGSVKTADGEKMKYSEIKHSFAGGMITKSTRTEIIGDTVKQTKCWTVGRTTRGTTKFTDKNGDVTEIKWEGTRSLLTGKFEITKSETTGHNCEKSASKLHDMSAIKAYKSIENGLVNVIKFVRLNKEERLECDAQKNTQNHMVKPTGAVIYVPKDKHVDIKQHGQQTEKQAGTVKHAVENLKDSVAFAKVSSHKKADMGVDKNVSQAAEKKETARERIKSAALALKDKLLNKKNIEVDSELSERRIETKEIRRERIHQKSTMEKRI